MIMKSFRWFVGTIILTLALVAGGGLFIGIVDPYFHYHAPIDGLAYTLYNSRYQNDGIVRHFDYDTLIIGTSMIANFRTTECDKVFGGKSIKVPMYGASFREVNDNLKRALAANPNIVRVIRCLEQGSYTQDKDYIQYEGLPTYLYDDNPFNDCEYVLNKEIAIDAIETILKTSRGEKMTTFDDFLRWQGDYEFGREAVLEKTHRPDKEEYFDRVADEEIERTLGNLRQNVTDTARAYPDVEFCYFMSPFSIVFWDIDVNRKGKMEWFLDLQRLVIEEILTCPNIKLYGYDDMTEITTNLDNYQDPQHYGADINSEMLRWMRDGKGLITKDNYEEYLERIRDFYPYYDYDSIYE